MSMIRVAAAAAVACLFAAGSATAGDCPGNPDALGTSRVLTLAPGQYKRVGTVEYPDNPLPLNDHEVVLTFDDGPIPPNTGRVLDALAAECVKATFFVVGQMARAHPALLQRERQEGHSIGTHSEHHAHLDRIGFDKGSKEITDGVNSAAEVLGDRGAVAPFFRFPYLDPTKRLEDFVNQSGMTIVSVDVHASDWTPMTPEHLAAIAIERIERKKRGILLLHDIHERTALAVPIILRELKKRGYSIVHIDQPNPVHEQAQVKSDPWSPVN